MIYVDEIRTIPRVLGSAKRYGNSWSHLWSDSDIEELHKLAEKIGLKRSYFQNKPSFPHYDVIPSKRTLALKYGAQYMSLKDWIKSHRK
jgi:hypothetical protein